MKHFYKMYQTESADIRERELEGRLERLIEKKVQTSLESLIKTLSAHDF